MCVCIQISNSNVSNTNNDIRIFFFFLLYLCSLYVSVYLFLVGKIKRVSYAQQGCMYLIKYIINNKHYCKKKNSLKHDFYSLIHYNEKNLKL